MITNEFPQTHTLTIDGCEEPMFQGAILPQWSEVAEKKGYSIVARVSDRFHLALRCNVCAGLTKTKLFVLMNAQPICAPCLKAKQVALAKAAGVTMLRRDPTHRHYAFYAAACGHELRRQFALIEQVAKGETGLRCEVCVTAKHSSEAAQQGWSLLGADPGGRVAYRFYRHDKCGAEQSVALGNMHTGRFDCAGCGESWTTAPSTIYVMRFQLEDGQPVIKLGFAKKPTSRLNHQLQVGLKRTGELLRVISDATLRMVP